MSRKKTLTTLNRLSAVAAVWMTLAAARADVPDIPPPSRAEEIIEDLGPVFVISCIVIVLTVVTVATAVFIHRHYARTEQTPGPGAGAAPPDTAAR